MGVDWEVAWGEHRKLVGHIARKYARPGITQRELCHVGMIGLWEASTRFDPAKGAKFLTFAEYRIEGRMVDLLRETFGVNGEYGQTIQPGDGEDELDVSTHDRGQAMVDALDEIEGLTSVTPFRWAAGERNRMNITWRGQTQTMNEWAREMGTHPSNLPRRIKSWGLHDAITRRVSWSRLAGNSRCIGRQVCI